MSLSLACWHIFFWVFLAALTFSGEPDCLKGKSLVTEEQTASLLVRIAQEGQVWDHLSPPSSLLPPFFLSSNNPLLGEAAVINDALSTPIVKHEKL